jgi:hypothetical protein
MNHHLLLTFWYPQSHTIDKHDGEKTEHGIKSLPRICNVMVAIQSSAECTRKLVWIQKSLSSSHWCEICAVMN